MNNTQNNFQSEKDQIIKDIIRVNKKFKKQFPDIQTNINRDFYRKYGKFSDGNINTLFGSFSHCIKEVFGNTKDDDIHRSDLDIYKISKNTKNKRYIVSAIIAGAEVDIDFFTSIKTYAKKMNAEIVLLAMRGVNKKEKFSKKILDEYSKYMVTEYEFNSNLKAVDFMLDPSQIISLTGISRMSKKGQSIIVGHSKLALEVIPSQIGLFPSLMYATGTICDVKYRNDRIGRIATQDHVKSGLIVETVDNKKFHIRNIVCGGKGELVDLGICYEQDKIYKVNSEITLGDLHVGSEDRVAINSTKEMIKKLDCKKIYIHDLFDARSVNPHEKDNIYLRNKRPDHQKFLKLDLDYLGNFLKEFNKGMKDKELHIIPSNHNDFVNRYLNKGEFVFDSVDNCKLSCELLYNYLENKNPIEYYLRSRKWANSINIKFYNRDDTILSNSFACVHGDKGNNGGKGSAVSFDKCFSKSITGNSHTPQIFRSSVRVGCLCQLKQDYIEGFGSSWLHSNCVTYSNETFQLIHIIEGEWKL